MGKNVDFADVIAWVEMLNGMSEAAITGGERREQHKYATLIRNPKDKIFLSKMLDESSQIRNDWKLSMRVRYLVKQYGIPEFFPWHYRVLMTLFQWGGFLFAPIAMPIFKKVLRAETSGVIIDEKRPKLTRHLEERKREHIGQNVNLLGEVVLGNAEADARYHHYLEALEQPDINYISIKLSGIYAQMHALNFQVSRPELIERVKTIYQKAIDFPYIDSKGEKHAKFINLDMEEYKDAHLTLDVFMSVLSMPQFKDYYAGIVVQAYLWDAWEFQTALLEFAKKRVAEGGSPIKMRLVKGANLQMETVVSSLRGWPNPVRDSKVDVDANYLHILDRALSAENAAAVRVGVASHNLYTIAYAHLMAERNGVQEHVDFEMLEGMANHLWRAMSALDKRVTLYTPVVSEKNFLNAVSYLVRRLDENTGPENFLSYSFNLHPDTQEWDYLREQFEQAYALKDKVECRVTRTQDRNKPYPSLGTLREFTNEPDTDFDLGPNKQWALKIIEGWKKPAGYAPVQIPVQIGGEQKTAEKRQRYIDHNQQDAEICVYEMSKASVGDIGRMIGISHEDPSGWGRTSIEHRKEILHKAADTLAARRGELIGVMCAVTGKTITEGDVEVSEAIDFCRFYPLTMEKFAALDTVEVAPKGVVVVISPWNFPLAIPCGGVVAALAGGNRVILKPATVAAPVAWEMAQALWDAGVPKEALHVTICDGAEALNLLTTSPDVRHTVLTGGTDTAVNILKANPRTPLSAETGGKNAIIVTSSGDRDKAILNVVHSAFGNAGQKCSACSLLLLAADIYDDPTFRVKLRDAATSIKVGYNWDAGNVVGGMISNRNDKMEHVFANLEPGQEWLVEPRYVDPERYILAPSILWGVTPESYIFRTELFAPVLAVVRIASLEEGIRLVNSLDYGLTSGLQSLDEREQALWENTLEAGNLYINRGITGAIVNRQPFGGMKLSAFGGGIKAGGVNYVSCFLQARDKREFSVAEAQESYLRAAEAEFKHPRDVNNLYGEQNVFRYLPAGRVVVRLFEGDDPADAVKTCLAARAVGVEPVISVEAGHFAGALDAAGCFIQTETLDAFLAGIAKYDRIRALQPDIPVQVYEAAAQHNKYVACSPVVSEGRLELLHYLKEQSIANEYHRYGSITTIPEIAEFPA